VQKNEIGSSGPKENEVNPPKGGKWGGGSTFEKKKIVGLPVQTSQEFRKKLSSGGHKGAMGKDVRERMVWHIGLSVGRELSKKGRVVQAPKIK